MKPELPYTIEVITGEKFIFLRTTNHEGVEQLEFAYEIQLTAGPAMHVHYKQDESITIVSGVMGYEEVLGETKHAVPGTTLFFRAGTPHRFWNAGVNTLYCTGYNSPANNLVYFLSEIGKSINENGGKPRKYDLAYLLDRYKTEFRMLEISVFEQKLIFPIILFLGKLSGKDKKFAEAPLPI